jgi:hypothetical protein
VLELSKKQCEKRAVELAQTARNVELEMQTKSLAEKIVELEKSYTDLQHEKDNMTADY